MNTLKEFIASFMAYVGQTNIPQQINDVDALGLFTNPWFMVPFIGFVGWSIYRSAFTDLIIVGLLFGVWYISGTPYMQTLIVNGEMQIDKVLPILFGGALVLAIIIYLLFVRK
ncbi:MAG: hypothetical protein CSA32_01365 [Desulfobulbus propionicus]|nr:MAG: hypothetical protein CSA32_01365 [Desulfobulbus propionicus]